MALNRRIRLTIILLGVSLLLVWAVFYFYTARNLSQTAERNMQRTAEQILDRLEVSFLQLEGIAFSIAGRPATLDFITEQDATESLLQSDAVDNLIANVIGPADTVAHLLTYTQEGVYTRFVGALGNTAAARLYNTFSSEQLPGYFGVTLEGVHYLCYASDIRAEEAPVGVIALLVRADDLLAVSAEESDYRISLGASGQIIASSEAGLVGLDTAALMAQSELYQRRSVGFAPFEILVTAEPGYLSSAYVEFIAVEVMIAAVFALILVLFLRFSNRHLFRPMLQVVRGVEGLGQPEAPTRLDKTGEESFDTLVEQVNQMLDRLDELQEIELDRQKSLIVSLKKQINAHFTVNVLTVINQLTRRGEMEKAGLMLDGLSSLLQYVNAGDEYISGANELQALQKYVTVMEIRYRERFSVRFDWDDALMERKLPRMLIQPIIENAITHGLAAMTEGGRIAVTGTLESERMLFSVRDNGAGMTPEALDRLRTQIAGAETPAWEALGISNIALANIQRRIWISMGSGYGLSVESAPGKGTTVTLALPLDGSAGG